MGRGGTGVGDDDCDDRLQPRSIDLLCFPEMAFTGYVFENATAIRPYLEKPKIGPTSVFCSELAKELGCWVVAGYPEVLDSTEQEGGASPPPSRVGEDDGGVRYGSVLRQVWDKKTDSGFISGRRRRGFRFPRAGVGVGIRDSHPRLRSRYRHPVAVGAGGATVGANSACLYDPEGEWVEGYRKTNLFITDKSWAKPGTGFLNLTLSSPLRNLTLGICMDLNPRPEATWTLEGPYEIADDCVKHKTNLLVMLNAWLDSGEEKEEKHDWQTLNYWGARLRPLWVNKEMEMRSDEGVEEDEDSGDTDGDGVPETIVVVCNRTGHENGVDIPPFITTQGITSFFSAGKTFAGSSALFSMRNGAGRPKLLDVMGRDEEGVRVWNLLV
ncbi:hypothetical protein AX16_008343 [Volvariella volvacea WC 439]|nr:hypothetical protein AX16_008343 [Volvariella volvacea WC 439]